MRIHAALLVPAQHRIVLFLFRSRNERFQLQSAIRRSTRPPHRIPGRATQDTACRTRRRQSRDPARSLAVSLQLRKGMNHRQQFIFAPVWLDVIRRCCRPGSTIRSPATGIGDRRTRGRVGDRKKLLVTNGGQNVRSDCFSIRRERSPSSCTARPSVNQRGTRSLVAVRMKTWLISCHNVDPQLKSPGLRAEGLSMATTSPNVTPSAPRPGMPVVRTAKSS